MSIIGSVIRSTISWCLGSSRNTLITTIALGLVATYGSYKYGHYTGSHEMEVIYQDKIDHLVNESNQKYLLLQAQNEKLVNDLKQKNELNYQEYLRGKEDGQAMASRMLDEHVSGSKRLYIYVDQPRDTSARVTTDSRHPRSTDTRAALSARSAEGLIGIAQRADDTQRELNLCKKTLWEYRNTIKDYNDQLKIIYKKK